MKDTGAQIVGISTLLTTTMLGMKDVLRALEQADLRQKVKVMVGGAPVTQSLCRRDRRRRLRRERGDAVDKAKELLGIALGANAGSATGVRRFQIRTAEPPNCRTRFLRRRKS